MYTFCWKGLLLTPPANRLHFPPEKPIKVTEISKKTTNSKKNNVNFQEFEFGCILMCSLC